MFQSAVAHELISNRELGAQIAGVQFGFKALSRMSSFPTRVDQGQQPRVRAVSKRCRA